jgi:hypothetical protein
MNRRSFFNKCAAFVAGCALAVGLKAIPIKAAPMEFICTFTIGMMEGLEEKIIPILHYRVGPKPHGLGAGKEKG